MRRFNILFVLVLFLLPSVGAMAEDPVTETPREITLTQAAALTLLRSPELASYTWKTRAAEARVLQASVRPNPELSLEIEDVRWAKGPGTHGTTITGQAGAGTTGITREHSTESGAKAGFAESQFTLRLAQVVELGGKRVKRMQLARNEKALAQWDYETARLDVLTKVAKDFAAVLGAQRRLELAQSMVELAEQAAAAVEARVSAGKVSPLEANKANTELDAARIALDTAAHTLLAARSTLSANWAAPAPDFERALGDLDSIPEVPAFDVLTASLAKNPDVARWNKEMETRETALRVEKSKRIPDVTVTVGLRATGTGGRTQESLSSGGGSVSWSRGSTQPDSAWDHALVFGLSMPLPIFDRNQGAIQEAACEASRAAEDRRKAEVSAHAALFEAHESLSQNRETVASLRDKVLPRAKDTYDRTREGYQQGKFAYLDVLDAQRTRFSIEEQYLDALTACHQSLAEVERLAGEPIPEVSKEAPPAAPPKETANDKR